MCNEPGVSGYSFLPPDEDEDEGLRYTTTQGILLEGCDVDNDSGSFGSCQDLKSFLARAIDEVDNQHIHRFCRQGKRKVLIDTKLMMSCCV